MVMRVFSLVAFYEAGNMARFPSSFLLLLTLLRMLMPHTLQKLSKGSNTRESYIANLVTYGVQLNIQSVSGGIVNILGDGPSK